jgi:hypothetical protein
MLMTKRPLIAKVMIADTHDLTGVGMTIALGCSVYLLLLAAVRHVWPDGILFYQGLTLAVATALLQWLLAGLIGHSVVAGKDALITFLIAYAFMFTIPTTVDRAYSVRLMVQLSDHPQGMTRPELEHWFSHEFAADGVRRRLTEQLATGSIEERDGRYKLTRRGQQLVTAFTAVQELFSTHSTAQ